MHEFNMQPFLFLQAATAVFFAQQPFWHSIHLKAQQAKAIHTHSVQSNCFLRTHVRMFFMRVNMTERNIVIVDEAFGRLARSDRTVRQELLEEDHSEARN